MRMKIKWLGHAMFELEDDVRGVSIITDPYSPDVGYPVKERTADIVTVSHDHYDHNYVASIKAAREFKGVVDEEYKGMRAVSFPTYHDEVMGRKRGNNAIFKFYGELTVAHLGDYGEPHLREEVKKFLSDADILLVPVGGTFTVGPEEAVSLIETLKPPVAIPMHYRTPYLKFELFDVEEFLKRLSYPVQRLAALELSKETLPATTTIYVLDCLA
jgi:L-ascorbate metabolism protein UlaG (beta-lactamase superfamily)